MKKINPLHQYLIKCDNRYNNKIDVDGSELILNTEVSENDYHYVNRIGTVLGVPLVDCLDIPQGSNVLVHHNVFRRWYNMRGIEKNSNSYYMEDLYFVDTDQIFAWRHEGHWKPLPGYCFVKPIPEDGENQWTLRTEKMMCGHLELPGDVKLPKGTLIGFTPNSEYEFNLDGEKLYRVMTSQITWYGTDD